MKKADVVHLILGDRRRVPARHLSGKAFAPSNIALCKYWGKREQELNLPVTSSLSISLGDQGASAVLTIHDRAHDEIVLNGKSVDVSAPFSQRLSHFLNLFRLNPTQRFSIFIETNVPIAAGLASSACGFASIVKALDALFGWELSNKELSILARLGSGSASRSIWQGFVEWHRGLRDDGMDCFAEAIPDVWADLRIGLLILSAKEKGLASREAMQRTVTNGSLYSAWPAKVSSDLFLLKQAIADRDFQTLGKTAESNALAMHATMLSAWPPIQYAIPETLLTMQKVWALREQGLPLYFTQDAGPNLKLLFCKQDVEQVVSHFPEVKVVDPFVA
ncbi:MAG: diphosphomevalonate decarboxylase [Gammaproteobacteria bacterium]|nr:diphosphomevalonate decarboxylase [Gammaproteobacteria bacterium]